MQTFGKPLIVAGIIVVIVGLIFYLFGNKLSFLGRLPGDIRVEKENFKFYFPVVTMLLVTLVINLIIWIVRRFFSTSIFLPADSSRKFNGSGLLLILHFPLNLFHNRAMLSSVPSPYFLEGNVQPN